MAKYSGTRATGLSRSAASLSSSGEKVRLEDEVALFDKREYDREFISIRLIGPVVHWQQLWVPFQREKGGTTRFPLVVSGRNPYTGEIENDDTPFHRFARERGLKIQHRLLMNAIIRDIQDEGNHPGKRLSKSEQKPFRFPKEWGMGDQEFYIKDHENRGSLTPVCVFDMTAGLAAKIMERSSLNKKKGSMDTYPVDDPEFGADLDLKYDSSQNNPADKWQVNIGAERMCPLTEEDYRCLIYDITNLRSLEALSIEEQEREVERFYDRGVGFETAEEAEEDRANRPSSSRRSRSRSRVGDDEDDSATDWGGVTGDDDGDSRPSNARRRRRGGDDDDDEGQSRQRSSSRRSRAREEDDDEDAPRQHRSSRSRSHEDDGDEDDEGSSPRQRRSSRSRAEDEDDDEGAAGRRSASRSRRSHPSDDDEDPFGDDDSPDDGDGDDAPW